MINENALSSDTSVPAARTWRLLPWLLVSILLCVFAGTALLLVGTDEFVQSIRVTKRGEAFSNPFGGDDSDLYLVLETGSGSLELEEFKDTPIGNGLTWHLDPHVRWEDLKEVTIWDNDPLRDDCLDRVQPTDWQVEGQEYAFDFQRRPSTIRPWLIGVAGACGLMLLVTGGLFVRDQVL